MAEPPPSDPQTAPPNFSTSPGTENRAGTPLFCRLLLDKNQGFLLEILDAQGQNQQSVMLDGVNMTFNIRGPSGQSTIVQTADRIALNAKDVSIDADTVRITSRSSTSLQSLGQTNLTSMADITVQTPGRLSQHCMTGFDMNTMSMSVNAIANATIQAIGGIGLFGVGGGVQIFGSTVSMTGLQSSISGLSLGLLAFDINIGTPSGGGTGGNSGGATQGPQSGPKAGSDGG